MTAKRAHEHWEAYRANILNADSDVGHEAERRAFYFGAWLALKHMRNVEEDLMEDLELGVDFALGLFNPEDGE